jgi:predicted ATPase/DNA-binding CsgD family transcriptional regulator
VRGLHHRSLPLLPTAPIGRQIEIAAAQRILSSADARLLTVTGPPGVGKTTLAMTVARAVLARFEHGVEFVDLAPISEPTDVAPAIADRLNIRPGRGRVAARLATALSGQSLLLVLDNFEQVADAAPLLADLLSACPRLRILVTSRVPLFLRWEHELPIAPLGLPDLDQSRAADMLEAPAVALFVERALAADPNLAVDEPTLRIVAEICRRLDGLPLAIELAAARTRTHTLRTILRQLRADDPSGLDGGPLDLLAGGPRDLPARQQTLRQAIDWSYTLLQPGERAVLRRLAAFVGGCTLDAVRAVCDASSGALASLIEKSLLRREASTEDESRVRLLVPIRKFALEQLQPVEHEEQRRRHAAYFVTLAELAEAGLQGADQPAWLRRLERDHDNLRAALRWAAERGDAETAVRLGGALWRFWWVRGYLDEGMRSLDEALTHADRATPLARAKAFHAAGKLARERGDYDRAAELCRASLAIFRELGDQAGAALALNTLANVAGDRGDYDAASGMYEESLGLRQALGDRSGVALALHNLAAIACACDDLERAEALDDESLALFRAAGDDWGVAIALSNRARTACRRGDLDRADALAHGSLRLRRTLGDRRGAILCLELVADLAELRGQADRAARLRGASEGLRALSHFVRPPDEQAARGSGPASDARLVTPELRDAWEAGRALDLNTAIDEALRPYEDGELAPGGAVSTMLGDSDAGERSDAASRSEAASLPPRERETAILLTQGFTNRQIAQALVITEGTAANYVRRVLERLGLQNRVQVAAWAIEHGLTRPNEPPTSASSAPR